MQKGYSLKLILRIILTDFKFRLKPLNASYKNGRAKPDPIEFNVNLIFVILKGMQCSEESYNKLTVRFFLRQKDIFVRLKSLRHISRNNQIKVCRDKIFGWYFQLRII